jgi:hypothetical protein
MNRRASTAFLGILIGAISAGTAWPETPADDTAAALAKFQADTAILGLASNLGTILGSEAFCGLELDQAGIAAWVKTNVPPDRMDFQGQLQMTTMGQKAFNDSMSQSAKTAHCAAVEQSAHSAGLLAKP